MTKNVREESGLQKALRELARGEVSPREVAEGARANSNAGKNVYIGLDAGRVLREAEELPSRFPGAKPLLYGLPVSVKDLFGMEGVATTGGSRFYAERFYGDNGRVAGRDSALVALLREMGAVIIGKTNLHQL